MSSIAQQAFGVLYDYAARTVAAEHDRIRSENAHLKPARRLLQTIQVFRGATLIAENDVLEDDRASEDDDFVYFAIEPVVLSRPELDQNLFQTKLAFISCWLSVGRPVIAGRGVFLQPKHQYGM